MPARKDQQGTGDSPLARLRKGKGLTQKELAEATGLSLKTIQRLEHDLVLDPPLGYYLNCAMALGVELREVLGDEQLIWHYYGAPSPPPEGWIDEARMARGLPPLGE